MLGKNLIATVLTQIPVFVLGVLSGVYSTRILGEDAKGVFSIFQANLQFFVLFFSIGIQTGIVYFISSKKISENKVTGMTLLIILISSVLLALMFIFLHFTDLAGYFMTDRFAGFLYMITLYFMFLFTMINSVLAAFLQAHSKFRIINIVTFTNGIVNALVFVVLFYCIGANETDPVANFNLILYATAGLLVFNTLLWSGFYWKEFSFSPSFDFKLRIEMKQFISYNLLIYIGMFINFFNYRLDLWIVNHYTLPADLSYYSLAANICQIILFVSVTVSSVIFPNLSGKSDEERIKTFIRLSRIGFVFFLGLILVAFLLSSWIIPFMYGSEFSGSILPFQILLPGILFSCITQLFSIFLVASNKNIYNILACSAGVIFTVALDFILIPVYGINGAALATLSSYFIIGVVTYGFIKIKLKVPTYNLFLPNKKEIVFLKQKLITLFR